MGLVETFCYGGRRYRVERITDVHESADTALKYYVDEWLPGYGWDAVRHPSGKRRVLSYLSDL